uniref:SET domain-containing protein n=1 Tax=Lepeophtheirus salmonis TaxID=72036 RepID=A0A0K2V828_LEPSM
MAPLSMKWDNNPFFFFEYLGGYITLIRLLLLNEKGKPLNLVANMELKMKDPSKRACLEETASIVMERFVSTSSLSGVTIDKVITGLSQLESNAYEVLSPLTFESLMAVYLKSSLINHSCNRNTRTVFSKWPNYRLTVLSSKDILKDEEITISYLGPFHTTMQRQKILKRGKCFDCLCERCSDPLELGSFSSGIKCVYCSKGYFLAQNPLKRDSEWTCTECSSMIESEKAILMDESLVNELNKVNKNSIQNLEKFLKTYEPLLHPRHVFILQIKQFLIEGMGRLEGYNYDKMDVNALSRKISLCQDLLEAFKYIENPLSFISGVVYLELTDTLYRKFLLTHDLSFKQSAKLKIVEALEILKYEDVMSTTDGTCLRRAIDISNYLEIK